MYKSHALASNITAASAAVRADPQRLLSRSPRSVPEPICARDQPFHLSGTLKKGVVYD